tara:strand:- start:281 stop:499 length:219 start_codon:yes stop_codon:yes gene_type:complete
MTTINLKTATKEEQLNSLRPLIDLGTKMLMAGTLKKNVVRHFTNKGLSLAIGTNLMELAEFNAEKLSHYKFN